MFFFYQLIVSLLLLISPLIIIFRIFRKKEDKKRFKEKFVFPTRIKKKGKLIWFHGASVGEILSIIPLIKNYEKNKLISQILITSSTLSSSKVLRKFNFKKTIHQFYPIDHIVFTKKFLNFWWLILFCQFVLVEMKLINNWSKQNINEGKNRYNFKSNCTHFGN